jgi:AcrR family transcriptional regulator
METRKGFAVSIMKENIEIIEAAIKVFQKHGLKFTMSDVAKSLHISKKTIYQYYASKEELLLAMLNNGFEKIQAYKQAILQQNISIKEKIAQIIIAMPQQYQIMDFRLFDGLSEKYPTVYQRLQYQLESNWEPVIALIKQGEKEGVIRPIPIPIFQGMVISTIEMFLSTDVLKNNHLSYVEGLNQMVQILMDGICTKEINKNEATK